MGWDYFGIFCFQEAPEGVPEGVATGRTLVGVGDTF